MAPGRLGLVLAAAAALLAAAPALAEEPRELAGNGTDTTTATNTTTATTTTATTQTSSTTSTTATTVTSTLTNTSTSTSTTSTSTTATTTTLTTSRTTVTTTTKTTVTRTTTTVTTTSVELGLTYCPAPNYYLEHVSSPLARCSATTRRPALADGPPTTRTITSTSTTAVTTLTGSQGFSESLLSLCCRSREQSSTRLPYTSINYLYQWPTTTTTTTRLASANPGATPPPTTTTRTTTTKTTTSTATLTATSTSTFTLTATSTSTLTTTPYTGPTSTETSTSSVTATTTLSSTTTTDSQTSTTVSTTTLTTSTTSSSTTTATTVTATSTTTTTATVTSTTTTTSSTDTSTTTTTSPRLFPCRPRCSRMPVTGCDSALSPGGRCAAAKIDTHCVSQESLLFLCPVWNVDPDRAPDVLGGYRLLCQVCGLAAWPLEDLDLRLGWLQLDIQFGPNTYLGQVLEDGISGYAVFMTDPDGQRLSDEPVATVDRKEGPHTSSFCCTETAYTARVAVRFPEYMSRVLFEIVPITRAGPLPSGRLTAAVYDRGRPAALSAAAQLRPAAWPLAAPGALLALAATVAAGARDAG